MRKKKANSKVIILTARSDFDNKELFLDTFRKHGLSEIDDIHVHRAGNLPLSTSEGKRVIIEKYLNTGNFFMARLFDDADSNLRMMNALCEKYPTVKLEAWKATPYGKVSLFKGI
jgi:hypothetical protein